MFHRIANILGILILLILVSTPVLATSLPPDAGLNQGIHQQEGQIEVTTNAATSITQTAATVSGYLESLGPYETVEVWFELSNGVSTTHQTVSTPGSFSTRVSGLTAETNYNYRAVAMSTLMGGQKANGNYVSFSTITSIPQAPINVSTISASDVTSGTATLNGYLSDMGPYDSVTVWFSWGNSGSFGNNTGQQVLYSPGPFSMQLSGLSPNTTYYFQAAAKPQVLGVSTVYGSTSNFNTSGGSALSVSTGAVSGVSSNSATIVGYLDALGGYRNAYVWFEWGTSRSYGQTTSMQTTYSPGTFTYTLQGLNPGTTYHFRALAAPSAAGGVTTTGADSMFTTTYATALQVSTSSAANVAATSATFNGVLTSMGSSKNAYVWFEYGTDTTFGTTTPQQLQSYPGNFSAVVNALASGRTYYYRAAAFANGVNVYGSSNVFRTGSASPISISTDAASSVSTNVATFNAYVNSIGTLPSVQVWFKWGNSPDAGTITSYQTISSIQGVSAQVTGLTSGTDYYFQAVAQAPDGTKVYGVQQVFTTVGNSNIGVSAAPATDISGSTAVLNGTLGSLGNTSRAQVWFEYGTTADYGNSTEQQTLDYPGQFRSTITGLAPGRTYYYRAVALNPTAGSRSVYSPASSFVTSGSKSGPTPQTDTIPMFVWLIGAGFLIVIIILIILLASRR
ncbi:MAG: hypothetical protein ABSA18_06220 [Dehalococcoidia bacterium]|jgi:hypothetical protein